MGFITNLTAAVPTTGAYINGLPSGVDNRHGNIRDGGTISDSVNWSSSALGEGNPVTTIVSGVGGVVSANQAASINAGTQVISVAQTTIAGISNTTLLGGQSNSANEAYTPLQADTVRTYFYKTAVIAGNWNIFNGTFSSITAGTASGTYDITRGGDTSATMRASGTDVAANPSQNYPGTLTYRDGSPNPTNDFYKARNNW